MRDEDKEAYRSALRDGTLSYKSIDELLAFFKNNKMRIEKVPKEFFKQKGVNNILTRLKLRVCYGKRSWEGLIIGFPGNRQQLSTKYVGTPYLRLILYPILDLYLKLQQQSARAFPCLYLLGERFLELIQYQSLINSAIKREIIFDYS